MAWDDRAVKRDALERDRGLAPYQRAPHRIAEPFLTEWIQRYES
jgi:hypothetical protein